MSDYQQIKLEDCIRSGEGGTAVSYIHETLSMPVEYKV